MLINTQVTQATQNAVFDKLKSKYANVVAVNDCYTAQHVTDTVKTASEKVAKKLLANKAFVDNGFKAVAGAQKVDKVYKRKADKTYAVGCKYGNRWLKDIFGTNAKMLDGLTEAQLSSALSDLAECAINGDFDNAIASIMQANVLAKQQRDSE